jgi:L-fuconolactonase
VRAVPSATRSISTTPAEGEAFVSWPDIVQMELESQRAILSLNSRPPATTRIARTVAKLSGCRVPFSHLGLPGQAASNRNLVEARLRPLLELAECEHVGVKLSGLYAVSDPQHDFPHLAAWPVVEALLRAFGPRRLYWSSDFPAALDYVSFAQALDLRVIGDQSDNDVAGIRGGNLLRLLRRL